MNAKLLRELKAGMIASDEIITFAWSALTLELHRCKWTDDEIRQTIKSVQELWGDNEDRALIDDAMVLGIDVLDYVGYNKKPQTKYGKRNLKAHMKAKTTVAALFSTVTLLFHKAYKWSIEDIDMLINNTVHVWNDRSIRRIDICKECEDATGISFRYGGDVVAQYNREVH